MHFIITITALSLSLCILSLLRTLLRVYSRHSLPATPHQLATHQTPPAATATSSFSIPHATHIVAPAATVIGATEMVIVDGKHQQAARIDTGAAISSLDAQQLTIQSNKRGQWAHFNFNGTRYCKKIQRHLSVTQQAGSTKRPVVIMHLSMSGIHGTYAFSLANRQKLQYPVLIGRNVLDTRQANLQVDVRVNPSICVPE